MTTNKILIFFYTILIIPGIALVLSKNIEGTRTTESSVYKSIENTSIYINRFIFKKNIIGNVHLGKDDYLFYLPKTDGNGWQDMYGVRDLENKKNVLIQWEEKFNDLDSNKYLFVLVPSKERVLRKYLDLLIFPDFKQQERYFDKFPRLKNVIDASLILDEKDYFKSDTHWNYIGAKKVVDEILLRVSPTHKSDTFPKVEIQQMGDITKMIRGFFPIYPETNSEIDFDLLPNNYNVEIHSKNVQFFTNPTLEKGLRVLLIGDSFRLAVAPLMARYVKKLTVVRVLDVNFIKTLSPSDFDLIVEVAAERYLSRVKKITMQTK